jgi:alanine-glyoxylate transaminase/(R)-3-amino-2-methylpropionate-pyruvate transaminase
MLGQHQAGLLRAARSAWPAEKLLLAGLWRSQSSQAAPVDVDKLPSLPPFDYTPPPYAGPSKQEVLAMRKQYLSPGRSRNANTQAVWRSPTGGVAGFGIGRLASN